MDLVIPMNYEMIDQEEMMYLDGGAISRRDKAWIIELAAGAVAIGVGAWGVAVKIMGYSLKTIVRKAGAAAVVTTLIFAIGITSIAEWKIANFATRN
ncbi:hypothetical protein ERUR111494_02885 [Erysipelothrix urinaevulpis]|uniref:hypothetical protein n=1 Tax=Erysipelothrix urinaevulpis TaxID=2683717 RepID=UPI002E2B7BDD|nr:hypothetical protein [Erysipelothrix urinaevulpis]